MNAKNNNGDTGFMYACHHGHKGIVKLLLSHPKIDLNAKNDNASTAFILACKKGHKDIVKLLLRNSNIIDINIPETVNLSE